MNYTGIKNNTPIITGHTNIYRAHLNYTGIKKDTRIIIELIQRDGKRERESSYSLKNTGIKNNTPIITGHTNLYGILFEHAGIKKDTRIIIELIQRERERENILAQQHGY